jgi:hypothetical protein
MAEEPRKAKMASRDGADGARSRNEARLSTDYSKTGSYPEAAGDLAPVYQEEGEQGPSGPSRSERDMEFVRRTMLSAQAQNVMARVELVGQDLILTASRDDAQRLKRSMRAFKSALVGGLTP